MTIRVWLADATGSAGGAQLDEAAFTATWAEGRAMPLEQAIAYALENNHEN